MVVVVVVVVVVDETLAAGERTNGGLSGKEGVVLGFGVSDGGSVEYSGKPRKEFRIITLVRWTVGLARYSLIMFTAIRLPLSFTTMSHVPSPKYRGRVRSIIG